MEVSSRIERIGKRDNWLCHYCGRNLHPSYVPRHNVITIDHVIPRALGGPNADWNYVLACSSCNRRKTDTHYERFTGRCVLPQRCHQKALTTIEFVRKHEMKLIKRENRRAKRMHAKRPTFEVLDPVSVLGGWSFD